MQRFSWRVVVVLLVLVLCLQEGRASVPPIYGFDVGFYIGDQDPNATPPPQVSEAQIRDRLELVAPYTTWVRPFSSANGHEKVPAVARSLGLKVAAGAWIGKDLSHNAIEIQNLIANANAGLVDLAIVGSEVLLRNDVSATKLIEYIQQVRAAVPSHVPVATADIASKLIENPAVLSAGSIVLVNIHKYWEGVSIDNAVCSLASSYQQVVAAAGGKPVWISETGWPSDGNAQAAAVPSAANASRFFLEFVSWAQNNQVPYFYFQSGDEKWKAKYEGPQGKHWGVFTTDGVAKPGMQAVLNGQTTTVNCDGVIDGPGTPALSLTYVPPRGDKGVSLEGRVQHVRPTSHSVACYLKVNGGWWVKPTAASPRTSILSDGSWACSIVTGGVDESADTHAAFLIPSTYNPPVTLGSSSLPAELFANALDYKQVSRTADSVSGIIRNTLGHPVSGVLIAMTGPEQLSTRTVATGKYSFATLSGSGSRTVAPAAFGYTYAPASKTLTSSGRQSADFTATALLPPTVATGAASAVSGSSATLNAVVNPQGSATTGTFHFGLTTDYGGTAPASPVSGAGTVSIPVSATIGGLGCGTTYHFRIVAGNVMGTTTGADATFTTSPCPPPTVTTAAATNVTRNSATLNAAVNPNGASTAANFSFGPTASYGATVAATPAPGAGNAPVSVGATIGGLSCASTYHFRPSATNSAGVTHGADDTFTTAACLPPAVTTSAATDVTKNSAVLTGLVNANGVAATSVFDYGPTSGYGSTIAAIPASVTGTVHTPVSAAIAGLACGTVYHYRVRASNVSASATGEDATFVSAACPTRSELISPAPGSTLPGSSVTLQWNAGVDVSQYWLQVSTVVGGTDVYYADQGMALNRTISGLPTSGEAIYVRLWSKMADTWSFNSYTFTAATAPSARAELLSPVPGSTLSSTTVDVRWSAGIGAVEYFLQIGTSRGGTDLLYASQGTALSRTVTGLPNRGEKIYVRLWTRLDMWQFKDYEVTAASVPSTRAELQSPAPGSTLSHSVVLFDWSGGIGVTGYWLQVGTTFAGTDLFYRNMGTALSTAVPSLPASGQTIYVRLWSLMSGVWRFNDYSLTATSGASAPAALVNPAPGSTLTSTRVNVQWSGGKRADQYRLQIGRTAGGSELLDEDQGNALSRTVSNLPADGGDVHVTLWSLVDGTWESRAYVLSAASGGNVRAELLTPAAGSTLSATAAAFQWSGGVGVTRYWLHVGTSSGGAQLFNEDQGTALNTTVVGLPTNGETIHVRVWSFIDGTWQHNSYSFNSVTAESRADR